MVTRDHLEGKGTGFDGCAAWLGQGFGGGDEAGNGWYTYGVRVVLVLHDAFTCTNGIFVATIGWSMTRTVDNSGVPKRAAVIG